jgi:galactose-1-phosphate uridylyltransferase
MARADGWHGILIFDEHDPLAVRTEQFADALGVALEWTALAHARLPTAQHLFLLWNSLWRAGATQVHAHMQVLLSEAQAQARVELWHSAASAYARSTGRQYFADLAEAHNVLGLTIAHDTTVAFASLTPAKEREVVILAPAEAWSLRADASAVEARAALAQALGAVIGGLRHLGGLALNVALFGPPLVADAAWHDFPTIARIVDRGDPLAEAADVAAMELFGSSVVAHDPFLAASALRACM